MELEPKETMNLFKSIKELLEDKRIHRTDQLESGARLLLLEWEDEGAVLVYLTSPIEYVNGNLTYQSCFYNSNTVKKALESGRELEDTEPDRIEKSDIYEIKEVLDSPIANQGCAVFQLTEEDADKITPFVQAMDKLPVSGNAELRCKVYNKIRTELIESK